MLRAILHTLYNVEGSGSGKDFKSLSGSRSRSLRSHGTAARRIAERCRAHRRALGHQRKVPQIAFKPDRPRHAKAAPFKHNDAMLETLPIGVMVFPGTGTQGNVADKAKKLGIQVWKFGTGGA